MSTPKNLRHLRTPELVAVLDSENVSQPVLRLIRELEFTGRDVAHKNFMQSTFWAEQSEKFNLLPAHVATLESVLHDLIVVEKLMVVVPASASASSSTRGGATVAGGGAAAFPSSSSQQQQQQQQQGQGSADDQNEIAATAEGLRLAEEEIRDLLAELPESIRAAHSAPTFSLSQPSFSNDATTRSSIRKLARAYANVASLLHSIDDESVAERARQISCLVKAVELHLWHLLPFTAQQRQELREKCARPAALGGGSGEGDERRVFLIPSDFDVNAQLTDDSHKEDWMVLAKLFGFLGEWLDSGAFIPILGCRAPLDDVACFVHSVSIVPRAGSLYNLGSAMPSGGRAVYLNGVSYTEAEVFVQALTLVGRVLNAAMEKWAQERGRGSLNFAGDPELQQAMIEHELDFFPAIVDCFYSLGATLPQRTAENADTYQPITFNDQELSKVGCYLMALGKMVGWEKKFGRRHQHHHRAFFNLALEIGGDLAQRIPVPGTGDPPKLANALELLCMALEMEPGFAKAWQLIARMMDGGGAPDVVKIGEREFTRREILAMFQ